MKSLIKDAGFCFGTLAALYASIRWDWAFYSLLFVFGSVGLFLIFYALYRHIASNHLP